MTKFQQAESRAATAEMERDNAYAVLGARIERERSDRVQKRRDMVASAVCMMMLGLGGAAFVYSVMDFIRWMIG